MNRFFDIIISSAAILLLSPVMIILSFFISMTGRKPIFKHKRIGVSGKEFYCFKFTSMKKLDELNDRDVQRIKEETLLYGKVKNDPRITKTGKIIRKTSIDELPQLFNVLIGDMSIVGPRPITEAEMKVYGKYIHHYLSIKPGVTGLWQVTGRSNTSYRRRVAIDYYYSKNKNVRLNIFIMIRTFLVVCKMEGAQ